jgi:hypothetical protein
LPFNCRVLSSESLRTTDWFGKKFTLCLSRSIVAVALYFVGTMARLAMANAVPGIVVSTISFQRRRMNYRTKSNASGKFRRVLRFSRETGI